MCDKVAENRTDSQAEIIGRGNSAGINTSSLTIQKLILLKRHEPPATRKRGPSYKSAECQRHPDDIDGIHRYVGPFTYYHVKVATNCYGMLEILNDCAASLQLAV